MKGEKYVSSEGISEGRGWSWSSGDYFDSRGKMYHYYGVAIRCMAYEYVDK